MCRPLGFTCARLTVPLNFDTARPLSVLDPIVVPFLFRIHHRRELAIFFSLNGRKKRTNSRPTTTPTTTTQRQQFCFFTFLVSAFLPRSQLKPNKLAVCVPLSSPDSCGSIGDRELSQLSTTRQPETTQLRSQ
jgi:hypothetical protein